MYRLLKYGGVLAIVDLDPEILKEGTILSQFRKWAFEVTELHIYNYYNSDMSDNLLKNDFHDVIKVRNDPINSIWMGVKKFHQYEPIIEC